MYTVMSVSQATSTTRYIASCAPRNHETKCESLRKLDTIKGTLMQHNVSKPVYAKVTR